MRLSLERFGPHVDAADQRGALGGLKHAGDHGNGGGLTRTVAADQPVERAGGNCQVNAVHRDLVVKELGEAPNLDGGPSLRRHPRRRHGKLRGGRLELRGLLARLGVGGPVGLRGYRVFGLSRALLGRSLRCPVLQYSVLRIVGWIVYRILGHCLLLMREGNGSRSHPITPPISQNTFS